MIMRYITFQSPNEKYLSVKLKFDSNRNFEKEINHIV